MQEVEDTHIHVPTTLDDDNSVASTITRSTVSIASSERRKMQLMDKYGTGKTTDYNKSTLQSFNRAVRLPYKVLTELCRRYSYQG